MYGAFIGDVIGSKREFKRLKDWDFKLFPSGSSFTDDSIIVVAIGDALMNWNEFGGDLKEHFIETMRNYGKRYPEPVGGYGFGFRTWLFSKNPQPYNSYGNGSAMRVSPCGLMAQSLKEALELARQSAEVTHNHPEGIKGAQATAAAIYLAKSGASREEIGTYIRENFYALDRKLDEIRPSYRFDSTCQGSVPESIQAFLESTDFETAIRNVISLGGDADTMGAITGSIAWPYYGRDGITPDMQELWNQAKKFIPKELIKRAYDFSDFCKRYTGSSDKSVPSLADKQSGDPCRKEIASWMDDKAIVRKNLVFYGNVQGVGFRWRALEFATDAKASGWIRKDSSGTVTMEIQSTEARIKCIVDRLENVPDIHINRIDVESLTVIKGEQDFKVKPNQ